MKKKRKWIKWVILAILALVVVLWLLLMGSASKEIAYTEMPVTVGDVETYYNFDGLVHAPHTQTLVSPAADTVAAVYVQQNQQVKAGDRILKLKDGEVVKADVGGEVTSLNVAKDDAVTAGQALCQIIDMDRLEIRLNVDEYDVGAVTPGTQAEVTVLATETTYTGTVTALDKNGTASGDLSYYTATVALSETQGVYPGMQVSAKVLRGQALGAVLVKMDALSFDDYNQPYVLVRAANGKDAEQRSVRVGVSDGIYAEITEGLSAGETVLKRSGMTMADMMEQMRNARGGM
ncbi:MAG: HlyD family efflux transporter periplasmic adaptor subunit [Clostridiales bacterium]|nr:HlyD family efflux transporter periplasmic adaptor subunit [Clostridiales bacterium]